MKYRLVILDFDGTLADTYPWFSGVVNDVAARFGFRQVSESELETLRQYEGRQILRELGVPFWKLPMIATHLRRQLARELDQINLFEGSGEMLQSLHRQGRQLAIVTSNDEYNVRYLLGEDLFSRVQFRVCGVSAFGKAAKIRKVLNLAGEKPGNAILIGDEVRDAEAARDAGVAFAAVSWGYNHADALQEQGPVQMFSRMEEIVDRLP